MLLQCAIYHINGQSRRREILKQRTKSQPQMFMYDTHGGWHYKNVGKTPTRVSKRSVCVYTAHRIRTIRTPGPPGPVFIVQCRCIAIFPGALRRGKLILVPSWAHDSIIRSMSWFSPVHHRCLSTVCTCRMSCSVANGRIAILPYCCGPNATFWENIETKPPLHRVADKNLEESLFCII